MREDPYRVYRSLREQSPLCRGGPAQWVVTQHAECAALLRDRRLSSSFPPAFHAFALGAGEAADFFGRILLYRDPPAHGALRQLLVRPLREAWAPIEATLDARVDALLQAAPDTEEFDLVDRLIAPMTLDIVCDLMGLDDADRSVVRRLTPTLAHGFSTRPSPEHLRGLDLAVRTLREGVGALVVERRGSDRGDLVSRATGDAAELGVDPAALVDNLVFLFFAGFETTWRLAASACQLVLAHPDQARRLRADPALVGRAVEEALRYEPPIQGVGRYVSEELTVAGQRLRPGRVLILLLGSANRDPRVFEDPERFDVGRNPNPHLSFGGGVHLCAGARQARAETGAAIRGLLRRFSHIELDRVGRPATGGLRGPDSLWIRGHA